MEEKHVTKRTRKFLDNPVKGLCVRGCARACARAGVCVCVNSSEAKHYIISELITFRIMKVKAKDSLGAGGRRIKFTVNWLSCKKYSIGIAK